MITSCCLRTSRRERRTIKTPGCNPDPSADRTSVRKSRPVLHCFVGRAKQLFLLWLYLNRFYGTVLVQSCAWTMAFQTCFPCCRVAMFARLHVPHSERAGGKRHVLILLLFFIYIIIFFPPKCCPEVTRVAPTGQTGTTLRNIIIVY